MTPKGLLFETTDGSFFTGIGNFSDDLAGPLTLWANGQNLGTFGAGDSVDFTALLGAGVSQFAITGIDPINGATGVPLYLLFDSDNASFTVQELGVGDGAVPEPSTFAALGGLIACVATGAWLRGRRRGTMR